MIVTARSERRKVLFWRRQSVAFERPFVKRFAICYQTVVCPVCPVLPVTLVYCGQAVGWIKMKLGMQVGLNPGHIVLDGDPAPLQRGGKDPNFQPMSVVAKWQHGLKCQLVWR